MYGDSTIPSKTSKALDTLRLRRSDPPLSARERQLLIVCDGRRSWADLRRMFQGGDPVAELSRLVQGGYLAIAPIPGKVQAPAKRGASRRSMAAAKLYLLDRLQLLRGDPRVAMMTRQIHEASDEAALMEQIHAGLALVRLISGDSTAERVAQQLADLLPEPEKSPPKGRSLDG